MLKINQTQLELLLAEMKRQNLDEVEIYHSNGYEREYDEAVYFRDAEWLSKWDEDIEYDLLIIERYRNDINVKGCCIKES